MKKHEIDRLIEIRKNFIIQYEKVISNVLPDDLPAEIVLAVLGNQLIRRLMKFPIEKDTFVERMSLAWDYHVCLLENENLEKKKKKD